MGYNFEIQCILEHVLNCENNHLPPSKLNTYIKETGNLFHIDISFHVYNSWHFLALEGARNIGDLCTSQKTT